MAITPAMNRSKRLTFVYYCSGHGYGHATRVSAFARHLLSLESQPIVHIVSSAPRHVFADSIALGALYRNADIDPVIVQPLAYRVDRRKSVEVLENFLAKKDVKVADESQWLKAVRADCVLSDAAFLGCLAANESGLPSVLITNFSFDSVFSYLSTAMVDEPPKPENPAVDGMLSPPSAKVKEDIEPDVPIPEAELAPLVDQILSGYRCADLLLRLPGTIPLPSFAIQPALPSPDWVDNQTNKFKPFILEHLTQPPTCYKLHPQVPFSPQYPPKPLARHVHDAPLLVRPPSADIHTPAGRRRLLDLIGIPTHLQDPAKTKILIVSFGGQTFHKPASRSHSRTPSKAATPTSVPSTVPAQSPSGTVFPAEPTPAPASAFSDSSSRFDTANPEVNPQALSDALQRAQAEAASPPRARPPSRVPSMVGRPRHLSQLRVAGAPPVAVPTSPRSSTAGVPTFQTIPPSPNVDAADDAFAHKLAQAAAAAAVLAAAHDQAEDVRILPDGSWIAVVCGVPKDWGREDGEELPEQFFVAPRDVYMPDLTAAADVLLGKLGYGTVAECVDARTPFVYVPRPLFVEEHGLRVYLAREGVGVKLEREKYEVGEWAGAVEEAYERGREEKTRKREEGETGRRAEEGREMAGYLVDWVGRWQAGVAQGTGQS
ncbi:hypothetical protein BD311DRAFT_684943 [Dichomitus squalens]|uniref:Uncharacterized protein n=1 Tax=Dichomitus squalens TaxID=114155 RepID=A0A4Q9N091_9APHY|nr:hypothetical protein BD311DRAFT_684943 [Dichomitus squalens]